MTIICQRVSAATRTWNFVQQLASRAESSRQSEKSYRVSEQPERSTEHSAACERDTMTRAARPSILVRGGSETTDTDSAPTGVPLEMVNAETTIKVPPGTTTVRVRPYRSSSSAQMKAMLSFQPRVSPLDRHNTESAQDSFRGFFTLFWIGLGLLFLQTSVQSWNENRTILSFTFGRLITRDAWVLAISDAVMVGSMFLCVPFVKMLQYRWIKYYWTGVVLQHMYQTVFLGVAVWWGFHRKWYWVQSGFLCLHALSMLMKMHSYLAHNGMLSTVHLRLESEKAQLAYYLAAQPGGEAAVLEQARQNREADLASQGGTPGLSTPGNPLDASKTNSMMDERHYTEDADKLRHRLNAVGATSTEATTAPSRNRSAPGSRGPHIPPAATNLPLGTSLEPSHSTTPHRPRAPHPLSWAKDEHVALLARNIDAMEDELRSNGVKGLVWPQNVTYWHFADYLIIPSLVYQLEYPRTATMRPLYVVEKVLATFGTFSLIYTITEHYIFPQLPKPGDSLLPTFINLCLPMMFNYLLIFYIIFECVCNGFAELSYFADREFYQDWWNSTSWDQFSRKWNKPVHTFLLRHVYASTISTYSLSRSSATFLTFLLSALCHELIMAVVSKKIRAYLFLMQMAQLPMIALGRLPAVKRNKTVGNIVFWLGLMSGFPLLAIAYLVY